MHYIVYETTNILNNKTYIGIHQTDNLNDGYLGSGKHLKRAINKYGKENFTRKILFKFDNEEDMLVKEAELVNEEYCIRKDTYNICVGGFGGGFKYLNSKGLNIYSGHSDQARKNIKNALERYMWLHENDPEWKSNFSRTTSEGLKKRYSEYDHQWLGRSHKEETKKKIGKANSIHQQGSKNSQFGSMWITNGTENKRIKKVDQIPEGWYKGRVNCNQFS